MSPKVSVVIAVYNREATIEKCLHSVLNLSFQQDYEVIVVDDGSTDATVSIVRSFTDPRIRLVLNGVNKGMCYSRNKGMAQACGGIIAFTDSDCIVDPCWLSELIKPFDLNEDIMITGGRIVDPSPCTYWEKVNKGMDHVASTSGYVAKIIGCNMAFQRQFLIDNPFDENLQTADEWDLCIRCERQNKKIFYTDKAIVIHYHRYSLKGALNQHFCYGYSNAYLRTKYGRFPVFNYGALVLTGVMVSLVLGIWFHLFYNLAAIFLLFFIILIGYWNARGFTRRWGEWAVTYPGYALAFLAFCLGNLSYPFVYRAGRIVFF